jgi:uncharacterized lipoprotein YbaY
MPRACSAMRERIAPMLAALSPRAQTPRMARTAAAPRSSTRAQQQHRARASVYFSLMLMSPGRRLPFSLIAFSFADTPFRRLMSKPIAAAATPFIFDYCFTPPAPYAV